MPVPHLLFLIAPVAGLVNATGASALCALANDRDLQAAVPISAGTAFCATVTAALLGTPLTWHLARGPVPASDLVEAIRDLPLVVPRPVAGFAVLFVLGRGGPAGAVLLAVGLRVVGTPLETAYARLFVMAPPFVSAAPAAFGQVDPAHEVTTRMLGRRTIVYERYTV
jgi:ABC-type sulfate transport system permease component